MVYDAARGVTLLFGGENQGAYYNDTWAYDGTSWQNVSPTLQPIPRARHSMAYDPFRERVVLIGGYAGRDVDDAWEWDGSSWTQVASNVLGVTRDGAAAFDPSLGGVLYNAGTFNMVWNGSTWNYLVVPIATGADSNGTVYDAASGGILSLFGRETRRFSRRAGWETVGSAQSFDLDDVAIANDPFRGRPVFYGGFGSVGRGFASAFHITWQWDGNGWHELNVFGPPPLSDSAMTFDLARRVFVLFGGDWSSGGNSDETWELSEVVQPASYQTFGVGCSGMSPHQPTLGPDPVLGQIPVLGGSFTVRIADTPSGQPLLGCLGASNMMYAGVALPLELSSVGMVGCNLYVSLDAIVPLGSTPASGVAHWTLRMPSRQAFVGQTFYQQALVLDQGGAPASVLWTNGGGGTIGYQ